MGLRSLQDCCTAADRLTSRAEHHEDRVAFDLDLGSGRLLDPVAYQLSIRRDQRRGRLIAVPLDEFGVPAEVGEEEGSSDRVNYGDAPRPDPPPPAGEGLSELNLLKRESVHA